MASTPRIRSLWEWLLNFETEIYKIQDTKMLRKHSKFILMKLKIIKFDESGRLSYCLSSFTIVKFHKFCLILWKPKRFLINFVKLTWKFHHFHSCHAKKDENFWQHSLWPLPKFGGKVWKIFKTPPFSLEWISFHFVSFTYKIFCLAQISQLPVPEQKFLPI